MIGIGIIGAGFMGTLHGLAYAGFPDVEIRSIADVDVGRAQTLATRLGGAQATNDYRKLLRRADVDAVSVCTLDTQHKDAVIAAARHGKHILVEKPLAASIADATEMIAACRAAEVTLAVGYLLRFDPRYAEVKNLMRSGQLGEPIHFSARRNSPRTEGPARYAGQLPLALHVMIHDVDLACWYLEPRRAVSVFAQSTNRLLGASGTQDSVAAIITFDDQSIAMLESSWALPAASISRLDAHLELLGTRAVVQVNAGSTGLYVADATEARTPDLMLWPNVRGHVTGSLAEEIRAFIDDIRLHRTPESDGTNGLRTLALTLAIIESAREDRRLTALALNGW